VAQDAAALGTGVRGRAVCEAAVGVRGGRGGVGT
jgi:hypothetical protein